MAHQFPPDVENQLRERMATGKYASETEVIRDALCALKHRSTMLSHFGKPSRTWKPAIEANLLMSS